MIYGKKNISNKHGTKFHQNLETREPIRTLLVANFRGNLVEMYDILYFIILFTQMACSVWDVTYYYKNNCIST